MQSFVSSSHMKQSLLKITRHERIVWTLTNLKNIEFDAIVVCGASSMVVGLPVAHILDKDVILVRKKKDDSHSTMVVEGVRPGRYVFIDDLISSGKTLAWVVKAMKAHCEYSECVGMAFYLHSQIYTKEDLAHKIKYFSTQFPRIHIEKEQDCTNRALSVNE